MIEGMIIYGEVGYSASKKIREDVFIKEQKLSSIFLKDNYESEAYHVLVYEDKKVVGAGRLVELEDYMLIGRIVVNKNKRGNHYGDLIVRMLVDKAFKISSKSVLVKSQVAAINFYKKIGFNIISNDYVSEGIRVVNLEIKKGEMKSNCSKKSIN